MDILQLGSVRNLIGKDLHIDFIVEFDRNLLHAQRGLQGLLGLQVGGMHMEIIGRRAVDSDGDDGRAMDFNGIFQVLGKFTQDFLFMGRNEQNGFGDGLAE